METPIGFKNVSKSRTIHLDNQDQRRDAVVASHPEPHDVVAGRLHTNVSDRLLHDHLDWFRHDAVLVVHSRHTHCVAIATAKVRAKESRQNGRQTSVI